MRPIFDMRQRARRGPPALVKAGFTALLAIMAAAAHAPPAAAVSIELKDVAPDRVENQRRAAVDPGPLPGTPDLSQLEARLAAAGVSVGDPVFIRVFKAEAELEVWMRKGNRFVLFATYPVCNWSGTIGPKLAEGDKQTPEGFYTVTRQQLHRVGRWPRSLNLGFPNVYDKSLARTGSYILVHGGCSSVGCFAMTNPVISEIYNLTQAAIVRGQSNVPVHVFPFRMTDANFEKHANSPWLDFWRNLREGHDAFEQTGNPPNVRVCEGRYEFDATPAEEAATTGPLAACGETLAAVQALDEFYTLARSDPLLRQISHATREKIWRQASSLVPPHLAQAFASYRAAMTTLAQEMAENAKLPKGQRKDPRLLAAAAMTSSQSKCSLARASCRKFVALQQQQSRRQMAEAQKAEKRRLKTARR